MAEALQLPVAELIVAEPAPAASDIAHLHVEHGDGRRRVLDHRLQERLVLLHLRLRAPALLLGGLALEISDEHLLERIKKLAFLGEEGPFVRLRPFGRVHDFDDAFAHGRDERRGLSPLGLAPPPRSDVDVQVDDPRLADVGIHPCRRHHARKIGEHGLVERTIAQKLRRFVQEPQLFHAFAEIDDQPFALLFRRLELHDDIAALGELALGLAQRGRHRSRRELQENDDHAHIHAAQEPHRDRAVGGGLRRQNVRRLGQNQTESQSGADHRCDDAGGLPEQKARHQDDDEIQRRPGGPDPSRGERHRAHQQNEAGDEHHARELCPPAP